MRAKMMAFPRWMVFVGWLTMVAAALVLGCEDDGGSIGIGDDDDNGDDDDTGDDDTAPVDEDGDGYTSDEDCDDTDPALNLDDADGDGFSTCDGDCDDDEAAVYPDAEEICDGLDNDCNPDTDETADSDGDGTSLCDGDCDDEDAEVYPSAQEFCDELDNNCDGQADESCLTDHFEQEGNNQVDVLWVVDNSCSMADEQTVLGTYFPVYYDALNLAGMDYHIAVVTTDNASFQGESFIDPTTPDGADVFADAVSVGTAGSGTERGLMFGYDALEMAVNGTSPNQGFFREAAGLRVIYVSDEPDQSGSWASYLADYRALKGNPDHVILSTICGTDGQVAVACSGNWGNASAGTGYVDVALATSGALGVICDEDWTVVMEDLGLQQSIHLADTFVLAAIPAPATIRVFVNDAEMAAGWAYDGNINAVVIDAAYVPQNGDSVDILYSI